MAGRYTPRRFDLPSSALSPDLAALTERLAENAHDEWAARRMEEGWAWGPHRDDVAKTHPCLVPYADLPESEKVYDRNAVVQTLRAIGALGYAIERKPGDPGTTGILSGADRDLAALRRLLDGPPEPQPADLLAFWLAHDRSRWVDTPELYRLIAGWLIKNGDPLLAHDVASEGLLGAKDDPRLRQLQGLALARSGAAAMANEVLGKLRKEGHTDEETVGILARTHKDLGFRATGAEQSSEWRTARDLYDEAHRRNAAAYWTGINSATLSLLLGETERARGVAAAVEAECTAALKKARNEGADCYWILATLGEAALVRNEPAKALDWYAQAVAVSNRRWGDVSSTRRQARMLLDRIDGDRDSFERCLRVPSVVAFAGHMIDRPDREHPRFPASLEPAVKDAIRERLREIDAGFGFSSCARGSDILFQEALAERLGETYLILPYPKEPFVRDSVGTGTPWESRFDAVRRSATEFLFASPHPLTWGGITYDYANLLLLGRALLHADHLQTDLALLAVWDGNPGDGPGGTASVVERWRRLGHPVEVVSIAELLAGHGDPPPSRSRAGVTRLPPLPATASPRPMPEIKAILCADVKDFSRLTEKQIVTFSETVLHRIAEITTRSPYAPRVRNTWGDGLFCIFDTVEQAGLCALELRDAMRKADWTRFELPRDLSLRIALHAGPVFQCLDPVTAQPTYLGAHVNYAARIEPLAPAGEIYASWGFAAQARAERAGGFACDYDGRHVSSKLSDLVTTYRVRRT